MDPNTLASANFTLVMGQYEVDQIDITCLHSELEEKARKYLAKFPNNNSRVVITYQRQESNGSNL